MQADLGSLPSLFLYPPLFVVAYALMFTNGAVAMWQRDCVAA